MKICAIGLRGIPDVMGGIESHCQQLYPKMVRQGAEVTVLARSPYVSQKRYECDCYLFDKSKKESKQTVRIGQKRSNKVKTKSTGPNVIFGSTKKRSAPT